MYMNNQNCGGNSCLWIVLIIILICCCGGWGDNSWGGCGCCNNCGGCGGCCCGGYRNCGRGCGQDNCC